MYLRSTATILFLTIGILGRTLAAEHPVGGDRLSIRDPASGSIRRSIRFSAIDEPGIERSLAPDPRVVGATVEVAGANPGDGSTGPITLSPELWVGLGKPAGSTGYRWSDRTRARGIKTVVFKSTTNGGTLTVNGGGEAWPYAITQPQGPIAIRFAIGNEMFCIRFTDFLRNEPGGVYARDAVPPSSCGTGASTTSTLPPTTSTTALPTTTTTSSTVTTVTTSTSTSRTTSTSSTVTTVTSTTSTTLAPGIATYQAGVDTMVRLSQATTNFGSDPELILGVTNGADKIYRNFMAFQLAGIPAGATVTNCQLTINVTQRSDPTPGHIRRICSERWLDGDGQGENQATWSSWRTGQAWGVAGAGAGSTAACDGNTDYTTVDEVAYTPPAGTGPFTFPNLAALCQDAVTNRGGWLRMRITQASEAATGNLIRFESSEASTVGNRPKVVVSWVQGAPTTSTTTSTTQTTTSSSASTSRTTTTSSSTSTSRTTTSSISTSTSRTTTSSTSTSTSRTTTSSTSTSTSRTTTSSTSTSTSRTTTSSTSTSTSRTTTSSVSTSTSRTTTTSSSTSTSRSTTSSSSTSRSTTTSSSTSTSRTTSTSSSTSTSRTTSTNSSTSSSTTSSSTSTSRTTTTSQPPTTTTTLPPTTCGNAVVNGTEECDDGNTTSGDGCSSTCTLENASALCAGTPTVAGTGLDAVRVASGLTSPLHVTAPPLDPRRLFITEQAGRVRVVRDGTLLATPFLDISGKVSCCGERGLLSVAFHPSYKTNGTFFVDYTNTAGNTVVARYQVSGNPDLANPNETIILTIAQPFANHNGGQLAFGPDGYLYIGMGDGGSGGDPGDRAQNDGDLLGKMLRIDVNAATYTIPPTNPFVGAGNPRDEIWAKGVRNPWRFSFDRSTGELYIADVGEGAREEVNVQPAGTGGRNYGWDVFEGSTCYEPTPPATSCPAPPAGYTFPVLEYDHGQGCSITGGFVYRGCRMPDLRGTYFYSDICTPFIKTFRGVSGGVAQNQQDRTADVAPGGGLAIGGVSSFGEDARGEVYVVDYGDGGNGQGEVYRLVPGS